ncbi:MAG: flavin-dependent oxidoreductase [Rhodospirillales bacterium]|nr:flavin-dependent oxidoreductase [Rhodospirillales bacterium]
MEIAIIGGGITGLALAMHLHKRGKTCRVYEAAPKVKELGVGITLLPHAMHEFRELGLEQDLLKAGIENRESCFFNRFGQLIYKEPRGKFAGYETPEVGIHRGRLHMILFQAARERLGAERILEDRKCTGVRQAGGKVFLSLEQTSSGEPLPEIEADIAIACEGVNSTIRKQLYPHDQVVYTGINTWRGTTLMPPILGGRTYMRVGSIRTGKIVIYPIVDDYDGQGNQLINWMAEIETGDTSQRNDWNKPGELKDFYHLYENWTFDWLDVAKMIRDAGSILEYPMVDKEPVGRWTFGRVTLAGDAAHPMYPRGSNGAAQGVIDARTLAGHLAATDDGEAALKAYEDDRIEKTAAVVRTNRRNPPDFINIKVEELVGDKPFENLDDYITQDELRALSDGYKKVAGFSLDSLKQRPE